MSICNSLLPSLIAVGQRASSEPPGFPVCRYCGHPHRIVRVRSNHGSSYKETVTSITTPFISNTMGAGAAVIGGNPRKLTVYTLMDPQHGHMIVEGRMTDDDEELFGLTAGYVVGAGRLITEENHGMEDTDWMPFTIESDETSSRNAQCLFSTANS